jgi:CubicO group peptidase (beta-lactamase class C family)
MIRLTYTIILFIVTTIIGFSQNIDTKKLDQYLEALEKNNKFMGSVALLKDGKVIYTKQVGFSDIETSKKPNKDTKYRIGSISKTFTATLIFKAIESNKISLQNTLDEFYPTIPNSKKITISNLLNHRSGIHNFTQDSDYPSYESLFKSEKEMIDLMSKKGSDFEPNTMAAYSNSNYLILSYILQKIYKKSYADILTELIIDPVSLKNTKFGGKIKLNNNESNSYVLRDKWIKKNETNLSIPMGAGGIISTPSDLTLFANALFNGKIINEKSLESMTHIEDRFGKGLFKIPFYDKISFGHTGTIDGFHSVLGYFPNEKCAFSLISNGLNYNNNDISIAVLNCLFNKNYEIPSFKVYKFTADELKQYLGIYSNKDFPLKIYISNKENTLYAQATGQAEFKLEAIEKDIFKFDLAGITLKFNPEKNEMNFKQGTFKYVLKKQ